jgi:hypothetical protein|tara:strand:- start:41 stop:193 length:153 start_codon:yes stop_codon:yes gene_type:complete
LDPLKVTIEIVEADFRSLGESASTILIGASFYHNWPIDQKNASGDEGSAH